MKKVLLFFVMVLLVVVSARSLFADCGCQRDNQDTLESSSVYAKETKALKQNFRAANSEYRKLKHEADGLLEKDIDEHSLHVLVRLLDVELKLVKNLLNKKTGADVEKLLSKREKLLKVSTKTVAFFYKTIMNFATSDTLFNAKRKRWSTGSLTYSERRNYLKRMHETLAVYRQEFSDKQLYVAQQLLSLPKKRYHAYVSQQPENICSQAIGTHINVKDSFLDDGQKKQTQNFYPAVEKNNLDDRNIFSSQNSDFGVRSELKSGIKRDQNSFSYGFNKMNNDFIAAMPRHEVAGMINDVSLLIRYEINNHVGSLNQRNKMFHGGKHHSQQINTSIEVAEPSFPVSSKAHVMFGTIRNAAAKKTMKLGWWNPDVYEENLRHYASRLEGLKDESKKVLEIFRQTLIESWNSLDNILMKRFQNIIELK